ELVTWKAFRISSLFGGKPCRRPAKNRPSSRSSPALPGLALLNARVVWQADQVGEDTIGARYPFRQLPVKGVSIIDVHPLAVPRVKQPALLEVLARVVGLKQRLVTRVPRLHELRTAFLNPTFEVLLRDLIGPSKDGVCWVEDLHFGRLVGNLFRIARHLVRI